MKKVSLKTEEVTQEHIDAWKKQYESVWKLNVGDKVAFVRSPKRKELSYAGQVGAKDPVKFNEYLLKTCWLAGDEAIQTVDSYFMGASGQLDKLIEMQESSMEKL